MSEALPSGFPPIESSVEIRILKKIFEPDEAELFCKLKLACETPEQIAVRTGLPKEGLTDKLYSMWERGLVESEKVGEKRSYRMMPWIIGIYEFQVKRMDKEFAKLLEEYGPSFGLPFLMTKPQSLQVIPVETEIPSNYEAQPYEKVSCIIETGQSCAVNDCICRKSARFAGKGCDKPLETCMYISTTPGAYDDNPWGAKVISKEEAYQLLKKAEDAALVHMTQNLASGHWWVCNCCGCCDPQLTVIRMGLLRGTVNSHFYAAIDPDHCNACGICKDERCQVNAIKNVDDTYRVITSKCIGCGLCASACPTDAITLNHKSPEELTPPPRDQRDWDEQRATARGVDFSAYK